MIIGYCGMYLWELNAVIKQCRWRDDLNMHVSHMLDYTFLLDASLTT